VACEIVTLVPPVLVKESVKVTLVPAGTLPKLRLAGLAVSCPEATPIAFRGMASLAPEIKRLPAIVPDDPGEKATSNVTLCPPFKVKGNVTPLTENPEPVVCVAKSVTFHGRVFVSTTGTVDVLPSGVLPKETVEGLAVTATLFTPEPATGSGRIEFAASLINLIMPPFQPSVVGVKLTLNSTL
jgi:hypothetical protein